MHNRYCSRVQDLAGQGCGRANYDAIRSFIRLAFSLVVSTGGFWYEGCKTIKRQSLRSVFGSTSCFGCAAGFSFFNTTDTGLNDTTTRDLTMCTSYSRPLDKRVPYLAGVRPSSCGGADGLEDRHEYVRVVVRHLALKLSKPGTEKQSCGRNAKNSP